MCELCNSVSLMLLVRAAALWTPGWQAACELACTISEGKKKKKSSHLQRDLSAPACGGIALGRRRPGWDSSWRFTWREITFAHLTAAQIIIQQTEIKPTRGQGGSRHRTIWPQQQPPVDRPERTRWIKAKEITHTIKETQTQQSTGRPGRGLMEHVVIIWYRKDVDTLKASFFTFYL